MRSSSSQFQPKNPPESNEVPATNVYNSYQIKLPDFPDEDDEDSADYQDAREVNSYKTLFPGDSYR